MKISKILASAFVFALAVSCTSGKGGNAAEGGADSTKTAQTVVEKPQNPKDLLPTSAEIDSVSYLLGVNYGMMIKNYNMGDLNFAQMKKGMKDFINAKGNFRDSTFVEQFKIDPNEMNRIINEFITKRMDYVAALNQVEGEKWLKENAEKDSVETTESGLQYTIHKAGNEVKATSAKDTVYVQYVGKKLDGTVFDESHKEDGQRFILSRVIKGWTEGMQLVGEGGSVTLYVPAYLAYGRNGNNGIEPNSVLIFDVDVISVKPFVEKVEETK